MNDRPVFGHRVEGCPYIIRPSAYALVRNAEGAIAVVRTPRGCFLPGGGIESGEGVTEAVQRETKEECGLEIDPDHTIGFAVEIVYSAGENACFEKQSTFVAASIRGSGSPTELDHELLWLTPAGALRALSHESHRWAVSRLNER